MEKIDFVVTWVDGADPEWLTKKNMYSDKSDEKLNSESRYRDWDIFKYWFRSVEKNAPWVNKIFLITEGHLPDWLNTDNEKLVIIKHSDYIDEKYLPTFNSNVIEMNIAKIEELSEHFVLFNDDMFINDNVLPEDFFKNGLPLDTGIFSPIIPIQDSISKTIVNNVSIINKYFNSREVVKNNFKKFITVKNRKHLVKTLFSLLWSDILGFYDNHIPISYKKKTFEEMQKRERDSLEMLMSNRFRTSDDISHWLMRYWQLCSGDFEPRSVNFGNYYNISNQLEEICSVIKNSAYKVICVNDGDGIEDFQSMKNQLKEEFERRYSEKSRFEK